MKLFSDPLSIPHAVRLRRASALRGDANCFGAFSRDDKLTMILEVDRALECRGASWLLVCDDDQQTLTFPLHTDASDYRWDRFVLALPMTDVTEGDGLFWCRFALDTAYGRIYTDHSRVGELSLTRSPDGAAEQLTVYDPAYDTPVWITGGIMYHIFVDRFCPGGEVPCKDYARLEPDWAGGIPEFAEVRGGRLANTTFFGGTLWGVAEQMVIRINVMDTNPVQLLDLAQLPEQLRQQTLVAGQVGAIAAGILGHHDQLLHAGCGQ